jgi:hypothetical protein
MIKAKINKKEYSIKTEWNDLSFGEWHDIIKAKDDIERVSLLTGIESDVIMRLDETSQKQLSFCLEFLNEIQTSELEVKDIRAESFGQKILLQQQLSNEDKELLPAKALVCYEYDFNNFNNSLNYVLKLPFIFVYSKGVKYLEQIQAVLELEAEHLSSKPTNEQQRAGLDMFDEFGIMNTVNALANGDILKYDEVMKIDYNTVFIKLKMSKFERIFNENYSKIMAKK